MDTKMLLRHPIGLAIALVVCIGIVFTAIVGLRYYNDVHHSTLAFTVTPDAPVHFSPDGFIPAEQVITPTHQTDVQDSYQLHTYWGNHKPTYTLGNANNGVWFRVQFKSNGDFILIPGAWGTMAEVTGITVQNQNPNVNFPDLVPGRWYKVRQYGKQWFKVRLNW